MKTLITTILLGAILAITLSPQVVMAEDESTTITRNLGGPRFGLTYVPGETQLAEELDHHDMGRVLSQFGWHFEHQVIPRGGGPQFILEFVPMLAGVGYGKIIPNLTLAMGMRSPSGWEFGMGPNLTVSKTVDDEVEARTSLLLAIGKSFNYSGVSIPVNLAFTTSPQGNRVSLIFGYAIGSNKSKEEPKEPETPESGVDEAAKNDWSHNAGGR